MKKKNFIRICCIGLLLGMHTASAKSLTTEMQTLNSSYAQFQTAADINEATDALEQMYQASLASQKNVPHYLHEPSQATALQDYTASYQPLLELLAEVRQLLKTGELEQAQSLMEQVERIKKQGHQRFK
jgi:soluble cytochrome b562